MTQIFINSWQKALASLERALNQPKDEYIRDATIQRFEYCYELSWKSLKRYLKQYCSVEENNIKNLFRIALKQNLIDNIEDWFKYHESRNITNHTYNEISAEEVYKLAANFITDAKFLLAKIEHNIEDKI